MLVLTYTCMRACAGKSLAEVEAAVLKEWDAAERRFKEALDYNQVQYRRMPVLGARHAAAH